MTRLTRNPMRAFPLLAFPSEPEPPMLGFTGSGDNTDPPIDINKHGSSKIVKDSSIKLSVLSG